MAQSEHEDIERPNTMGNNSCRSKRTVVFSCAGAYNVGQIANQAASDLQQEGMAEALCLSAVACYDEAIAMARNADRIVGIDGCESACTKQSLQRAGLGITDHVTVTGLCIAKKDHDGTVDIKAVTRVKNAVKARLESIPGGHG